MSMADRDGLIWFDGKMVDWRDARIHVLTHTLHYGMGVFEGVRAYDAEGGAGRHGRPLRADPHLQFSPGPGHRPPHQPDPLPVLHLSAVTGYLGHTLQCGLERLLQD